jgi:cell division septation protein DedD
VRGLPVTALLLCAGVAAAGCGSSAPTAKTTTTTTASVVQQAICPSEQQPGIAADFGRFKSVADANRMIERARSVGFQGLEVQRRGCNDFAVVLRGLKSVRQGRSLQQEARSVGLKVTLECRSLAPQGGLAAVFGHRRTRRAAARLARTAASRGFQGLQVVQERCTEWEVVLFGLKTAQERRAFAREARSVGFNVTFEPG